jgi:hypothetical protein
MSRPEPSRLPAISSRPKGLKDSPKSRGGAIRRSGRSTTAMAMPTDQGRDLV